MARVTFLLPGGERRQVTARAGWTLLEVARDAGIPIEGACGGAMACATCHVILEESWFVRLPVASPEEEAMLDFAESLAPTSRLGCQIRVTEELDGLVVAVPPTTLIDG
ncbi:Ferredoxin-6 [bacterium HR40]|nr:Ferredoxin-6 [bacterium HR40]